VDPVSSVPCFTPTSIASEPLLGGADPFNCWDTSCPASTSSSIFRAYCYVDIAHTPTDVLTSRVSQCLTPNRPNPTDRVAFLVGDSHAASIKMGVHTAVQHAMSISWMGITGQTCGYIHSATGLCLQVRNIIDQQLNSYVRAGDVVIFSHAGYKYYTAHDQQQQRALLRTLYQNVLQPRGANMVIVGDPPILPMHAVRCLYAPQNCYASLTNNDQNAQLASLATESTGILYMPIHHLFCDSSNCKGQVPGTSTWAYFDASHLTTSGSLYLWPYFCSALEAAGFL